MTSARGVVRAVAFIFRDAHTAAPVAALRAEVAVAHRAASARAVVALVKPRMVLRAIAGRAWAARRVVAALCACARAAELAAGHPLRRVRADAEKPSGHRPVFRVGDLEGVAALFACGVVFGTAQDFELVRDGVAYERLERFGVAARLLPEDLRL